VVCPIGTPIPRVAEEAALTQIGETLNQGRRRREDLGLLVAE